MYLDKELFTATEVSVMTGMSSSTVYAKIKLGDIKSVEVPVGGRLVRKVPKKELIRLREIYRKLPLNFIKA